MVDEVERLVRLRDSRDPRFDPSRLSTLARDLIIVWDVEGARRERLHKTKVEELHNLMAAMLKRG